MTPVLLSVILVTTFVSNGIFCYDMFVGDYHILEDYSLRFESKVGALHQSRGLSFDGKYCVKDDNVIKRNTPEDGDIICTIDIISKSCGLCIPEVCIDLSGAKWYGMAELHTQKWPIGDILLPKQPFVTNDLVPNNTSLGNVLESVWFNSEGIAVSALFDMIDLSYKGNENKVCFWPHPTSDYPWIRFKVIFSENIKDAFLKYSETHIQKPQLLPDLRMMKSPIWSTWAKYKVDITEDKVLQFAEEIILNGFSNSQIEIDDMFSTHYGDFDFNPKKFPDPTTMIKILKSRGFRVTVWITPFANLDSDAFKEGLKHGYWLKDEKGEVPALVKWWQGVGATLDVFNEAAVDWFIERLNKMKELYGIDSFKFDAGEATYLPKSFYSSGTEDPKLLYTREYVKAVSRMGSMIEVRCGYKTQGVPVFVRMGDKESRWGYDNGLKTLIPTVLTMGILGYPYILPDMIGGNGYGEDTDDRFVQTVLPDRELFIRWLELTAYLPAMQFSFVPWQYDTEVVDLARKYVKIHEDIVTPIIIQAAKQATLTGAPLIRPLWWIAPRDPDALECDSEFLVGASILVAPVLEPGARSRDIYLPEGIWEDTLRQDTILGSKWLRDYHAELDQIPTFNLLH